MNEEEKGPDPNLPSAPGKNAEGFKEMQDTLYKAREVISEVAEGISMARTNVSDFITR
jgi:hypothetical protein